MQAIWVENSSKDTQAEKESESEREKERERCELLISVVALRALDSVSR